MFKWLKCVIICGGYRCLGSEYAGFIPDFILSGYSIENMEIINAAQSEITLHYVINTQTNDEKAQDLAGLFHVDSGGIYKVTYCCQLI